MYTAVVGNEACDADSVVSAVAYATFKNLIGDQTHIPIAQCPGIELSSRLDVMAVARLAGNVDLVGLRFIDDPSLPDFSACILVDHHKVAPKFSAVPISEILDHHRVTPDDPLPLLSPSSTIDIRVIGSCCTIVAERILQAGEVGSSMTPVLKMLLLTILIDTGHLSTTNGMTTETDVVVVTALKKILGVESTDELHDDLLRAKYDRTFWFDSPLEKILRYDYKQFGSIGMASILRPIAGLCVDGIEHARENILCVKTLIIIASYPEDGQFQKLRKQIFLCGEHAGLGQLVVDEFQLTCLDSAKGALYSVSDPKFCRKRFAPIFLDYVNKS
jgi:exopolyphosphatase